MEKAFEYIVSTVGAEFAKQGFSAPAGLEDSAGPAALFTSGDVGYSVLYNEKTKCFVLRSCLLDESGKLCMERAKLAAFAHGEYFALGKSIGKFGFSAAKKKKQGRPPQNTANSSPKKNKQAPKKG